MRHCPACSICRTSNRAVGAGFYPARAVKYHKFDRADANPHAPVGADASVRSAGRIREYGRANAKPYHVCRGRCRALPARRTTVFTIHYGDFAIAPRADRGVRPYRTLCGLADGFCSFATASCRGERGIDPYELYVLSCCHVCTAQGLPLVTKGRLSFPKYILFPQPGVEICFCV